MHTVVVQQQITTIELMKEQSKKQKKTKNKRIEISCMKGLICKGLKVQNSTLQKIRKILRKKINDMVALTIVEPVLSGHPLLCSQFSKFRTFAHTNAVIVSCIKRPRPPFSRPMFVFLCSFCLCKAATLELKPKATCDFTRYFIGSDCV